MLGGNTMKILVLLCFILTTLSAYADSPPATTVKSKTYSGDGTTAIGATGSSLNVNVTNSGGLSTVNQGNAGVQKWLVDGSGVTQPVSGTLTCNAGSGTLLVDGSAHAQPVTGTFWQTTQPVSGTLTCNAGSGTQAVSLATLPALTAGSATIGNVNINGTVPISGTITATNAANGTVGSAAPGTATLVGGSDGTALRALKTSATGVLSVDGSATTQPVSGTVTANAGTGTFTVDASGHTVPVSGAFFQATQPISAASLPLPTGAATAAGLTTINTTLGSPFQAGGSIGNTAFGISGTLPAFAVTPTFNLGTLNGAATATNQTTLITNLGSPFQAGGSIGNTSFGISGTLPAFTATPTFNLGTLNGAATATNQTTGNTSLSSIDGKTPALGQALAASSVPVVLTAAQVTTLTPLTSVTVTQGTGTNLHTVVDSGTVTANAGTGTFAVSAASLPLPTGAATSSNQTTAQTSLTSIATNTGKTPTNANASLSARQTVTGTETNLSAPSNTVGVILECESVNADNLRWGFSNAGTAILSSTLGVLCEPGRDSGYLPLGAGTVLHMISTGAGSDFLDVQWVLAQ
jgi:hypothetical protein